MSMYKTLTQTHYLATGKMNSSSWDRFLAPTARFDSWFRGGDNKRSGIRIFDLLHLFTSQHEIGTSDPNWVLDGVSYGRRRCVI